MNNTIEGKEILEANLEAMYAVVLSICDPYLKTRCVTVRTMKRLKISRKPLDY